MKSQNPSSTSSQHQIEEIEVIRNQSICHSHYFDDMIGQNLCKPTQKYKVLLVNDQIFQLLAMRSRLEAHPNTEIVQAMNGDQAVKLVQKNMSEF